MVYEECAAQLLQLLIYNVHSWRPANQALQLLQGEVAVLYLLHCLGGSATPGGISRRMNRSASRITNTLNALEEKGYIQRQHESGDRRMVTVHLTSDGRNYMKQAQQRLTAEFSHALTCLTKYEAEEYLRLNLKLSRSLHGAFPCPADDGDSVPLISRKGSA